MNIFFYVIIFAMGITFGSFYTLAVYRIPKGQDITHTHSYCPNCNHKLGILDLIPVFSYIFLGAKCRYCKQKIRPRYFILETISGIFFVILAYLMKLSVYNLQITQIVEYGFLILYFTFIILVAGIDKENRTINKPILMYGIIISIMYIVYLYIIEKTSIYRYVIYLILFILLLIIDCFNLRKNAKNNYNISVLILILVMTIFTSEYVVIVTIITTIVAVLISNLIKISRKPKSVIIERNKKIINVAYYLSLFNIVCFVLHKIIINFYGIQLL